MNEQRQEGVPHSFLTRQERWLLKTGLIVGCGGLNYGYNVGIISGALIQLAVQFTMNSYQKGLIVSLLSVGSLVGCVAGGYISDEIGRWRSGKHLITIL